MSREFTLRTIPLSAPWDSLKAHLYRAAARTVLGFCPQKLQLDPRIYEIVSSLSLPYLSSDARNPALAAEVIRQMHIDFVVATRVESLALFAALRERGRAQPRWHIIVPSGEKDMPVPEGAYVDIHEFPGQPYGS